MATITPTDGFDPATDSATLNGAMRGFGTDEESIINVLGNRTGIERMKIYGEYQREYQKDIIGDLKSELSGDFEDAIVALMTPQAKLDALELRAALTGKELNVAVLVEILFSRSLTELGEIKQMYATDFQGNLVEDVRTKTTGYIGRMLTSQLTFGTDDQTTCNLTEPEGQEILLMLNSLLRTESFCQLKERFDACADMTFREILGNLIAASAAANAPPGVLYILRMINRREEFFADRLYNSLKRLGTDERTLTRIIVSRAEVDLATIMVVFEEKYGETLASLIDSDVGGDYKRLLFKIIEH